MPYAVADLEKFVADLGLPADKAKMVLDSIGADEGARNKFGEHVLRQQDYSSKMDALKTEQQRLETEYKSKVAQEEAFHASVATWKTEAEKKTEEAITKARREAEDRLANASAKIRTLATNHGIPEDEIKDLLVAPANPNPNPQPRDPETGKFMTTEQYLRDADFYARLPGIMSSKEREYYRLYGTDAPDINWDKVIDASKTNKKPLGVMFDETYKLAEKRQEIEAKKHADDIAAAEKRGEEAALSKLLAEHPEMTGRVVNRERPGSPILERAREHAKLPDAPKPSPNASRDAVSAAVQAFQDGKYKSGQAA
jgi:hypothetical protein